MVRSIPPDGPVTGPKRNLRDTRGPWRRGLGGTATVVIFLFISAANGAVVTLVALICSLAGHELVHACFWKRITGRWPRLLAGRALAIGLIGRGQFDSRSAALVLMAPAGLIPAALGAALVVPSVRGFALTASAVLIAGSGSDFHFFRKMRTLPPGTLLIDRPDGFELVDGASNCCGD